MAKFEFTFRVFNINNEVVYKDSFNGGNSKRPKTIPAVNQRDLIRALKSMIKEFNAGEMKLTEDKISPAKENKKEIVSVSEKIIIAAVKKLVEELRPDLKGHKTAHYISVKNTSREVIQRTSLDILYKEKEDGKP
jgi:hypothetical protein